MSDIFDPHMSSIAGVRGGLCRQGKLPCGEHPHVGARVHGRLKGNTVVDVHGGTGGEAVDVEITLWASNTLRGGGGRGVYI